eukprot:2981214-Pleurochrysis_carterae.AAC.1
MLPRWLAWVDLSPPARSFQAPSTSYTQLPRSFSRTPAYSKRAFPDPRSVQPKLVSPPFLND